MGTEPTNPQNQTTPTTPPASAPPADPPATPPANDETSVPLKELQKERKARQALESELAKLKQSQLSDQERLAARLKELEPYEGEVKQFRERAERQRDDMLKKLPKDVRARAEATIDGLPLAKQVDVLEALAISVPTAQPPATPPVERGTPAPPSDPKAPKTYAEWKAMPEGPEKFKYRDLAATLPD